MFEKAEGVWLDSFNSDWFNTQDINKILKRNKQVCIVSPDLHKREYKPVWGKYKEIGGIMLCTDYPMEAERFFNDKN